VVHALEVNWAIGVIYPALPCHDMALRPVRINPMLQALALEARCVHRSTARPTCVVGAPPGRLPRLRQPSLSSTSYGARLQSQYRPDIDLRTSPQATGFASLTSPGVLLHFTVRARRQTDSTQTSCTHHAEHQAAA
jgi:hypothetical protein